MSNDFQIVFAVIMGLILLSFIIIEISLILLQNDIRKNRSSIKQLHKYVEKLNGHK